MNTKILTKKIDAYNLQDVLTAMAIVGIALMLALPYVMPLIVRTKSIEAQSQLKFIYNNQMTYRYMYSKYTLNMSDIDFEPPKTITENGTSNYFYEIVNATNLSFKARATAITDFDGDGIFNIWEIDENGNPKQVQKD